MFSAYPFSTPQYGFGGYGRPTSAEDPYNPYDCDPYSRAQAEQLRRAQQAALRRRQLEEEQRRKRRQRASLYMPDEYPYGHDSDDEDKPRYDYGLGRSGYDHPFGFGDPRLSQQYPFANVAPPNARNSAPTKTAPKQKARSPTPPQDRRTSIPIFDKQPLTSAKSAARDPSPLPSQPRLPSHSPEVLNEAASKIQKALRVHHALRTITGLESKFAEARSSFSFPELVDFQYNANPEQTITVNSISLTSSPISPSDIPTLSQDPAKLAYTAHNRQLLAYIESLNRLLTSLDAVESWGEKKVRERRKQLVRTIEAELQRIEGLEDSSLEEQEERSEKAALQGWRGLWRRFVATLSKPSVVAQPVEIAVTVEIGEVVDVAEPAGTAQQVDASEPVHIAEPAAGIEPVEAATTVESSAPAMVVEPVASPHPAEELQPQSAPTAPAAAKQDGDGVASLSQTPAEDASMEPDDTRYQEEVEWMIVDDAPDSGAESKEASKARGPVSMSPQLYPPTTTREIDGFEAVSTTGNVELCSA